MKFTQLKKLAYKSQLRSDMVSLGLAGHSIMAWLRYVLYRIKMPVFFKILSRALLLIEIWLIYEYFSYNIFSNITLYLFILILAKSILRGVPQFYRNRLFRAVTNNNQAKFNILLSKALVVNVFCALGLALIVSLVSLKLEFFNNHIQFFILSWCLLLPLEQITSLLWSSVYLKRRLPRSFITVLACRLFPAICLVYLHTYLGALSYILGVLIGRFSEKAYLISLSFRALEFRFRLKKNDNSYYRITKEFFLSRTALRYIIFHAGLPAYFLGTGILLFMRNELYGINYVIYYFLLNFSVFITSQISKALSYDVFQSIRSGKLQKAQLLIRRSLFLSCFLSLLLTAVCLILVTQSTYIYLFLPEKISDYLLLLLLLQIILTIIFSQLQFLQAASLEHKNYFMRYILFALTVQALLVLYYKVNLQTVYITEIFIFFILALRLFRSMNLSLSPFYFEFIKKEKKLHPFVSPECFQLACRARYQKESRINLYLLAFHERDYLPEKILESLPQDGKLLITRYTANIFLVSTEKKYQRQDFKHFSLMSFADISMNQDGPAALLNSVYRFMYSLDLRNTRFQKIKNYFRLSQDKKDNLVTVIDRTIDPEMILADLSGLPKITIKNHKIRFNPFRTSQALKEIAYRNYFNTNQYIIPNIKGSVVSVRLNPNQTFYFDLSVYNGYQITLIKRQLFFINQYCYFSSIAKQDSVYSVGIREYLLVRHMISQYSSRKKTSAVRIANLDYRNNILYVS